MIDETTIKPALTPGEWAARHQIVQAQRYGEPGMPSVDHGAAEIHAGPDHLHVTDHQNDRWAVIDTPEQRHALAALCLEGQPFGFTQEDVALLRKVRECYDRSGEEDGGWVDTWFTREEGERFVSLAARLAALLPAP